LARPLVALLVYGIYGSPDLPARPQADRLAHAKAAGNDRLADGAGGAAGIAAGAQEPARGLRPRGLGLRRGLALSTVPLVALLVYGIYGSPDLPARPQADRLAHAT
jgi:cytochrome c-type biogenesis protein CcmH